MSRRIGCISSAGVVLVGLWNAAALAGVPASQPAATRPVIPIVELHGDGAAMGRQHGQALAEPIRLLFDRYLRGWFGDAARYQAALQAAMGFAPHLSDEHRAEIQALAAGAGLPPQEVMLANCFLDLAPPTACSTITLPAAAAPDKVARFGRTLDFASMGVADARSILLVIQPKDRYAFAAVSWPGLVGVLSGMNEHGLALANMEVARPQLPPRAMPYTLLYRTVLERCRTVDEAIVLLEKTPRQSANNLMLMDAAGERAVVEIRPERITVRRAPADAALISTNHQRGSDRDTPGRCRRYDLLSEQAKQEWGRIDEKAIEAMLARVAQGNATMQAMVFEPGNRVMYVATGAEATRNVYERIDLARHFGPISSAKP